MAGMPSEMVKKEVPQNEQERTHQRPTIDHCRPRHADTRSGQIIELGNAGQ